MLLKPDYNLENVYKIDFEALKKQGIKCLMFDLDSTVMVSKSARFTKETLDWFNTFLNDFEVAIISNNKNEQYIENASQLAPCKVIGWANKPNPRVMGEYLHSINIKPKEAVMIGDRPLSDIFGGERAGMTTILVDSISKDEENFIVRFARFLERLTIKR